MRTVSLLISLALSVPVAVLADDGVENEARLLSSTRQLTFAGKRAGEGYFSCDSRTFSSKCFFDYLDKYILARFQININIILIFSTCFPLTVFILTAFGCFTIFVINVSQIG